MDLFFFDKAEKIATGIPKCNLLRTCSKVFRLIEFFLALAVLSWSLTRLPFVVRISGQYFGKLFGFVASPLFGFILCNAIIVALVAKPNKILGETVTGGDGGQTDRLYEEFLKSGSDRHESFSENDSSSSDQAEIKYQDKVEEIVYQDKEIIAEVKDTIARGSEIEMKFDMDSELESVIDHPKELIRTLSEKLKRESLKTPIEKLRRSETEKCRNLDRSGENSHDILYYQDDLSSEEFRRKIEEFIAREKKFRREESFAIVLHSES